MKSFAERLGVGAPFTRHMIDGVDLAVSDEGEGEALVFLHAVGHGGRDFGELRRRLRGRYRVVTLDWPGQGRSGPDSKPASADRYADLLETLLDDIRIERPVLIGNSIGGAAAILWAARRPADARALVLCNPGGLAPVNLLTRSFSRAMAAFFRAGARGAAWFPTAFALYYRLVLQKSPAAGHRKRIIEAGPRTAGVLAEAWSSFAQPASDLRSLAGTLDCPVLIAWARTDTLVSYPRSRRAVRGIPKGDIHLLRGGHAAFLEDAEAFDSLLDHFLERVSDYG